MVQLSTALLAALAAAGAVQAHPGHDVRAEAAERARGLNKLRNRSLVNCQDKLQARGHVAKAAARRAAAMAEIRKRTVMARDLDKALNTSHHSSLTGITPDVDSSVLFSGNSSCSLVPETTQGPYYVTGEMVRSNVTEDQVGVPLYMDMEVIDTNTCEPLEGVALDYWHCNATGMYSGISAQAGLATTWLRGIQVTDADGVVQFQSIMPGHYAGRTHHIHALAHAPGNWTTLANGTISGGNNTPHIGQVFFDQDLVNELETLEPYSQNTQQWTKNDEDNIVVQEAEATGVDPMANYVLLGDSLADGVFAWVSMGIDPTANYHIDSAVFHTADGGIEDPCFEMINLSPNDPPLPPKPDFCSTKTSAAATATPTA